MALTFKTTYETYFRKQPIKTRKLKRPVYDEFTSLPEGGKWLDTTLHIEDSMDEAKAIVSDMYKKRYVTTYQKHYCHMLDHDKDSWEFADHQFLKLVGKLYETNHKSVLPPLDSARRVLGYMNPTLFHINMSAYQDEIGKTGYKILAKEAHMDEPLEQTPAIESPIAVQKLDETRGAPRRRRYRHRPTTTTHCICYCY